MQLGVLCEEGRLELRQLVDLTQRVNRTQLGVLCKEWRPVARAESLGSGDLEELIDLQLQQPEHTTRGG